MQRLLLTIAAMLLSCGAGQAQTAANRSALGATSPLSGLGSPTSGAPTGIPLGATEINPGGLSPLPCSSAGTSLPGAAGSQTSLSTTASAGSPFDGGGMSSGGCALGPSATVSSAGTASPLFTPGATGGSSLAGGAIPLGATEIDSAGVSPLITVPSPSVTSITVPSPSVISTITVPTLGSSSPAPCTGSTTMGNSI